MEAVGQLTGGIAHDFNNLLMIIGGSLDMLGRRMPDEPKVRKLFDAARQAVGRGAKLNQQLLAFSRRQDLHMEVVQINELIPTFEHLLDRAVGETVKMSSSRIRICGSAAPIRISWKQRSSTSRSTPATRCPREEN